MIDPGGVRESKGPRYSTQSQSADVGRRSRKRCGAGAIFALADPGSNSSGSSSEMPIPAVIPTSTSTGALNPPLEGTMLAEPVRSVVVLAWLTLRITGIAGLVGVVSPPPAGTGDPVGRRTVV